MPLESYIAVFFGGNQAEFARHMGVNKQQVTKWLKDKWIVMNGSLYSPRRSIP